jgi:hypothetical protein
MPKQASQSAFRRRAERGHPAGGKGERSPSLLAASEAGKPPWFLRPEADLAQGLIYDYMKLLEMTDDSLPPPMVWSEWFTKNMFDLVESSQRYGGWSEFDESMYQSLKKSRDEAREREDEEKKDRPEYIHKLLDGMKIKEDQIFGDRAISRIFFNEVNAIVKRNDGSKFCEYARTIWDHYKNTAQAKLYDAELATGHLTP